MSEALQINKIVSNIKQETKWSNNDSFIRSIRDEPVVVAITLDELLLAGQIPIELRYILFSAKVILVMFSLHKLG